MPFAKLTKLPIPPGDLLVLAKRLEAEHGYLRLGMPMKPWKYATKELQEIEPDLPDNEIAEEILNRRLKAAAAIQTGKPEINI